VTRLVAIQDEGALGVKAPQQRVVVIGQGYVGLPMAMLAVEAGYEVVGIDLDRPRIAALRRGESYVDDVTHAQLRKSLDTGRYTVSAEYTDAASFAVAVISVPTPLRERSPDMSCVISAAHGLAPHVTRGCVVILESTTYPGTTDDLLRQILEHGSGLRAGADFALGYSPERVDPGNDSWTLATTPKVVSGFDAESLDAVRNFYGKLVADVVPVSSTRTAETVKLLENTFRHVNIALVNEFAIFARQLGVDVWEVIRAASTKPFGFMPFYPGPGVGGHCLPIDPTYLAWHVEQATGRRFRFVDLANEINDHMPEHVVQRITQGLNRIGRPVRGSNVLVLGLSYKKNSSDARESPATHIVRLLRSLGAQVTSVDDHVPAEHLAQEARRVPLGTDVVRAADAVVLLTDHDAVDYSLVEREARWILDCRNRLSGANVEFL
jgi:UDP-N-acetyl-D-glucosamine dehydrogenase